MEEFNKIKYTIVYKTGTVKTKEIELVQD